MMSVVFSQSPKKQRKSLPYHLGSPIELTDWIMAKMVNEARRPSAKGWHDLNYIFGKKNLHKN